MKRLLILLIMLLIMLIFATPSFAAKLAWDASTSEGVEGYILYATYNDWATDFIMPVGNVLEVELDEVIKTLNLHSGVEYTFRVTCYDSHFESGPSNEVKWKVPGGFVVPPVRANTTTIVTPKGTTINIIEVN